MLEVCYLNTEEQQHGLILNNYRGVAGLEVCYSNAEEQQCLKCVILVQRSSSAGSVLF